MEGGFLSGQLLISMPGISDPRFERTLILLCAHDDQHAMGLALNRPIEGLTIPDLLEQLEIKSTILLPPDLVLMGGPVERKQGFVLHTDDYGTEFSLKVGAGVALTTTPRSAGGPWALLGVRADCAWRWAMLAGAPASWSRKFARTSG